jgi:hypothetical protein
MIKIKDWLKLKSTELQFTVLSDKHTNDVNFIFSVKRICDLQKFFLGQQIFNSGVFEISLNEEVFISFEIISITLTTHIQTSEIITKKTVNTIKTAATVNTLSKKSTELNFKVLYSKYT